jgi:hypothetical protein
MHSKNPIRARAFAQYSVLLVAVLFLLGTNASAQSGRRAPKRTTTVATASGPKAVEKKPEPAQDLRIPLVITIEDHNPFSGLPFFLSETIRDTCADSLRRSATLKVDVGTRGMSRGDAVKRAKSETLLYVVWLQIDTDSDSNRTSSAGWTPESLYLRFTIFSPVTARIKASGRTHPVYRSSGGGVLGRIPSSRGGGVYSDYFLKQLANEAAERIRDAFTVAVPDVHLPG